MKMTPEELDELPPQAEEFFRLAIGAMEQAQRFINLAKYNLMRGN